MPTHAELAFFTIAFDRSVVRRAARIAVVVGTILALINHGDNLMMGQLDFTGFCKILLTFFVPYCVSTYSSVLAVRDRLQSVTDTPD